MCVPWRRLVLLLFLLLTAAAAAAAAAGGGRGSGSDVEKRLYITYSTAEHVMGLTA